MNTQQARAVELHLQLDEAELQGDQDKARAIAEILAPFEEELADALVGTISASELTDILISAAELFEKIGETKRAVFCYKRAARTTHVPKLAAFCLDKAGQLGR